MVTIAVVARKPETQKRYRTLLANAGVETHYVTDLEDLARCVKSRPVDLILFDLDDTKLSAPQWVDRVRQDDDLGLTPVLWIGTGVSATATQAADAYRPGLHVLHFPGQDTLTEFISALIGRRAEGVDGLAPAVSRPKSADWKPEDLGIDHALRIFADPNEHVANDPETTVSGEDRSMNSAQNPSPKKPAQPGATGMTHDYDWFVAEMNGAESERQQASSDSGIIEAAAPAKMEKRGLVPPARETTESSKDDDLVLLDVTEMASMRVPTLDGLSGRSGQTGKSLASQSTGESGPEHTGGGTLVDQVAAKVASQLASEIVRHLDHDAIRKAVEAALTKPQ